ncbi:sulfotransferase [Marivibrio halodurans]|uniref:Sulfotransferase n=1 Tax=Marivibrio halodurans TaxID=2039722 RepID=A0A8J7SK19_9PROT|nr:tetratricopeptide repeat-containing sulfotransferase family protein [Marivibrio halodurans]MBP5858143.1 sulfotransferase [Marivibrio halodurans]
MANRSALNPLGQQLQAAFGLQARGRLDEAEAAAKRILKMAPKEPNALYLLGILAHQRGDTKAAAQHFEKSHKADPRSVAALSGLGIVRLDQRRYKEARDLFRRALDRQKNDPKLLNNLGLAHKGAGDMARAVECFRAALSADPRYATAALNLGDAALSGGDAEAAEQAYRHGLSVDPDMPELHNGMANILADRNDLDAAIAHLRRAHDGPRGDRDPDIACNLANLLVNKNRMDEAVAVLRQCLDRRPEAIEPLVDLADVLRARGGEGDQEESNGFFARAAEIASDGKALDAMKPIELHRAARALEVAKRYDASFACQRRAQSGWRAQASAAGKFYDRGGLESLAARTAEIFATIPAPGPDDPDGHPSDRPIFILGMPRSGTSLAEQILSSHADVFGAGELATIPQILESLVAETGRDWPDCARALTAERRRDLAQRYLDALPAAASGKRHLVDKLPPNFWYLGFIRLLFPKAAILHTVRDPMDTGLSIFTQRFSNDLLYDHDLGDIGHYYGLYRRVMDFWEGWDVRVQRVVYEAMIADQAGQSRALLALLGLDWDDRVLDFHKTDREVLTASRLQVRQPIYTTSVEKWRRYETGLKPLAEALGPLADYKAYLAARDH